MKYIHHMHLKKYVYIHIFLFNLIIYLVLNIWQNEYHFFNSNRVQTKMPKDVQKIFNIKKIISMK